MRELIGVLFLMWLQITSMILAAIGGAWTSAGQVFHVYFIRCATRHDLKYALTPAEMEAAKGRTKEGAGASAGAGEKKWVN